MPLRPDHTLAVLNARSVGRLPGLIGIRFTAVEDGMLAADLELRPELIAPNGYLHAATVIALADTACGYGCLAHLPEGAALFTTIELKSNFLGTAKEGAIAVVARPAHLGRMTQVWDAVVSRKPDGGTIALFRCTQMILWPVSQS
jgi:1,4-dihydroxy-2-naphthoyl-CoA hydrolase